MKTLYKIYYGMIGLFIIYPIFLALGKEGRKQVRYFATTHLGMDEDTASLIDF